jgi:hypothetical protein
MVPPEKIHVTLEQTCANLDASVGVSSLIRVRSSHGNTACLLLLLTARSACRARTGACAGNCTTGAAYPGGILAQAPSKMRVRCACAHALSLASSRDEAIGCVDFWVSRLVPDTCCALSTCAGRRRENTGLTSEMGAVQMGRMPCTEACGCEVAMMKHCALTRSRALWCTGCRTNAAG